MGLLRIVKARATEPFVLELTLGDGTVVERDVSSLLEGPVFDLLKRDRRAFEDLRVEGGTVVWSNGADLCPDVLIYGGPSPVAPIRSKIRPEVAATRKI